MTLAAIRASQDQAHASAVTVSQRWWQATTCQQTLASCRFWRSQVLPVAKLKRLDETDLDAPARPVLPHGPPLSDDLGQLDAEDAGAQLVEGHGNAATELLRYAARP